MIAEKKTGICIALLLLFAGIFAAGPVSADIYHSSCSPQIKIVSQDPAAAVPNEYVKVVFEFSNMDNCDGMAAKLISEYPFSLDSDSDSVQTLEGNPHANGYSDVWTVPYKIRVADDALDGDYDLKLSYHEGSGSDFSFAFVKDFNITIEDVHTNFDAVIQGVSGSDVSIAIANVGKYAANAMVVRIPEQEYFRATDTNGQMVGNLDSGDYSVVSFALSSVMQRGFNVNKSSAGQKPVLKFDIYYTDSIGKRRIVNMELPLSLSGGNSSTLNGAPAFGPRARKSKWSGWYTFAIIMLALIIFFVILNRHNKKIKQFMQKKFNKKNSTNNSGAVPDWIKNAKGKEGKK